MNWYKKAQRTTMPHRNMVETGDWDKVVRELEIELGRQPTSDEVQERMFSKYWNVHPEQQMDLPF